MTSGADANTPRVKPSCCPPGAPCNSLNPTPVGCRQKIDKYLLAILSHAVLSLSIAALLPYSFSLLLLFLNLNSMPPRRPATGREKAAEEHNLVLCVVCGGVCVHIL